MRTLPSYDMVKHSDLSLERMKEARGDILRLADVNFEVPGLQETGLFAVPYVVEPTGSVKFALCDGTGKNLTDAPTVQHLILWIVRTFNDRASLSDMARGMI